MAVSSTTDLHGNLPVEWWHFVIQIVTLGIVGLSLWWAPIPPMGSQLLLGILASSLLLFACLPIRRGHGEAAAFIGGFTVATACWLSQSTSWTNRWLIGEIPRMAPIALGSMVLVEVIRVGHRQRFRRPTEGTLFRKATLISVLLIGAAGMGLYGLINYIPPFNTLYLIEHYQLEILLGQLLMLGSACWLGAQAICPVGKCWRVFPFMQGGFLLLYLLHCYWQGR